MVLSYFMETAKDPENNNLYISQHLLRILKLYGEDFDYKKVGISVLNGGSYFKRTDVDPDTLEISKGPLLFLKNPQDEKINLGNGVTKMNQIKEVFKY